MKITVITVTVICAISGCSALRPPLPEQAFQKAIAERQYQSLGERPQRDQQRVYVNDRPTGITTR